MRERFTFLQIFLTLLVATFLIAVTLRIRSYSGNAAGDASVPVTRSTINAPAEPSRPQALPEIVVAPDGTTSFAGVPSAKGGPITTASLREQQYKQLLATPLPASAVVVANNSTRPGGAAPQTRAPQPQSPSMLQKLVQPIKNLFGGGSAPPMQPGSSSGARPNPPSTDNPRQQQPGDKPADKDPSTDTTPPQVVALAFDPLQVADGDTASVIVTAVDDMTGIRGISGTVTSPSGKALQGFAAQRESESSNRYIGRITIPKEAESGLWHVNFLNLSDNAANSVTLSYAQAPILQTAVLKVVSSAPDNTPPTLKAVWLDKNAMRAGEKNTLYIQAVDDKSGVNLVSGMFVSPAKFARIGFACRGGDNDTWTCDFTPPTCLDCGDWSLEQIQLQDKASNIGWVRQDNALVAAVKVNIMGEQCDNTPPVLQGLQLETNSVASSPAGSAVTVSATVTDDMCGVGSVSAQVVGPNAGNAQGQFFPFHNTGGNVWVGQMPIPPAAGKGPWKINWLQVTDSGQNQRIYYGSDPLLVNAVVQVR